jgi:hypothetical protein
LIIQRQGDFYMGNPSRFTSGVATSYQGETLAYYPLPDPFHTGSTQNLGISVYTNDFNTLIGTDYTTTGSSSTFALSSSIVGGAGVLTPGGTTTATAAYKNGSFLQFQAGNQFWYSTRIQTSAVAGSVSYYVGLRNGSGTTDGLWFAKAASSTSINLVSTVGSTATTLVTGVATAAAATWVDLGLYFDGTDLLVYGNNNLIARVSAPTIGSSGTTITDAILTPVFQITPTATDTLTVDFVLAAQELVR